MSEAYELKPTRYKRCIICGGKVTPDQELVGGQMKRGGTRCAHKKCWDEEQTERAKKEAGSGDPTGEGSRAEAH